MTKYMLHFLDVVTQNIYVWAKQSQFEKYNLKNDKRYLKNVVCNEIIDS